MSLETRMGGSIEILAAGGGGVEVDFALGPIAIQIGLFILLWALLKPALFEPMVKLFEEREKRIEGAKLLARKTDEASAGALSKYEEQMAKARAAANQERDKLRAEGIKAENEILGKVRAQTAKSLEEGRAQLNGELTAARTKLKVDVQSLAKELAGRVLGREVQ
jgi:F-type H+-transporting ATPase subunit b